MNKYASIHLTQGELKAFEKILMIMVEDAYTNKEIEDPEFSYYLGCLIGKVSKSMTTFEQKNKQTG